MLTENLLVLVMTPKLRQGCSYLQLQLLPVHFLMHASNVVIGVIVLVGRGMPENRRKTFMACLWLKVTDFILPTLPAPQFSGPGHCLSPLLPGFSAVSGPPLSNTSILYAEVCPTGRRCR